MRPYFKVIRAYAVILLSKLIDPLLKAQYVLSKGINPLDGDLALPVLKEQNRIGGSEVVSLFRNRDIEKKRVLAVEKPSCIDIVILTPKLVEFRAIIRLLNNVIKYFCPRTQSFYRIGSFKGYHIAVRETKAGNSIVAVEAERAITLFKPQFMLLVGMAGAVSKKLDIGDVVIGERSYAYEAGVETENGLQRRDKGDSYDAQLIELAKSLLLDDGWTKFTTHKRLYPVKTGPIAAGEKVIKTSKTEIFNLIQQHCQDAVAVEMEAVGFSTALSAYRGEVRGINIRSISDKLDEKAKSNAQGSRELASENAAAFAFELISNLNLLKKKSA